MRAKIRRTVKEQRRPRVTVLLSGGIDSTSCLAYYLGEGFHAKALFVDYGQIAAKKERRAAKSVSAHFGVPLKVVRLNGVSKKGPGLIIGRNAFLLLTALLDFPLNAGTIALGIHSGTRYRDCTALFVRKMQGIFDICTAGTTQIGTPFLRWGKGDVWTFARSRNVPLRLTYSCERGLSQPCGSCNSCLDLEALRASSLHEN